MSLLYEPCAFVPILLHPGKFQKRGYNQSFLLSEGLTKRFDITVIDCLKRVKHTRTQVGLSKEECKANITDAFALQFDISNFLQKYRHIFLVDDVVISGAKQQRF